MEDTLNKDNDLDEEQLELDNGEFQNNTSDYTDQQYQVTGELGPLQTRPITNSDHDYLYTEIKLINSAYSFIVSNSYNI